MSRLLKTVLVLLFATAAQAQTEIVLDNVSPHFATTGTWPTSTAVSGYVGANYQSHAPNGAPPGAIVVDNTDAGFSVTGTWPASTSVAGYVGTNYAVHAANGEPPTAIVADNTTGTALGTWPTSTSVSGYYGANYQPHAAGTGAETFTWTLNVATAGTYEVYARWTAHPNRASNAKYTVTHAAGQDTVTLDQQMNSASWQLIGTYSFNAGAATVSLSDDANGYVIADAVMLAPPGAAPNTATWNLAVPSSGGYEVYARWTQHPNRATNAPYTVNHAAGSTTVLVNQEAGGGTWHLLGTFAFTAGNATVTLTDQANDYVIADSVMLLPPGSQPNSAIWTPNVAQAGTYEVYARWTANPNRATNAPYTVTHAQGSTAVSVDQKVNGGVWNLLGTFQLSPGSAHNVTLTDQANGYVIADAIRLVPVSLVTELKLHFVHVDHLNTPRAVYDDQQQLRWRWDQVEAFGVNVPNENPASLGGFDMPLRFPGQFADKETKLHYNYFRDYDAAMGRYVQSDPIGLAGGINTYAYVRSRSTESSDPSGLNPGIGCLVGAWAGPPGCIAGAGVGGLIMGGIAIAAILSTPSSTATSSNTANACKPTIPDVEPKDLCEQLALAEAKAGAGRPIISALADEPRLVAHYGPGPWVKMQHTHRCFDGRLLKIHYFSNGRGLNVELKFVQ